MIILKKFTLVYFLIKNSILNMVSKSKIIYISENADWVIKKIGYNLNEIISNKIKINISIIHYGIKNSIVHYGSIGTFLGQNRIKIAHKSNKIVVTWFHVIPNDSRAKLISEAIKYVDIWHTSCTLTQKKMIALGIPKNKITVIPLGIDLRYFKPIDNKNCIKDELNIPKDKIIIGSFQKDGNGWGKGDEPKLIKGPDIFCDVVEKLAKKYDIFVLLTGPARGYVKNRLKNANIPFKHDYLDNPNEVAKYFQAIDLYIVTSREEGGPKSVLESMACGVPLISTKVGMALDIIKDGENGFLVDIEDVCGLYNRACEIIDSEGLQNKFVKNGLKTVKNYDWKNIANQYYEKIYKGLL